MELVEKKYRDTPNGHKKHAKKLTDYINFLVSKGRILEAKHFFYILYNNKPNHANTIRLGYALSIASFDNEGVRKFDQLLYKSKPKDIELSWFRLKYYLSVNNSKGCEDSCEFLLSKTLNKEHLRTIVEACINLSSYSIADRLVNYLEKERLELSTHRTGQIKRILCQRLIECLQKA